MDPEEVEVEKVTSGKAKSPGRVAWGKKLAALAKAHKEEKATVPRQPARHQMDEVVDTDTKEEKTSFCAWLAVGSLAIGIAALYYQRRATQIAPCVATKYATAEEPALQKKPVSKIIGMQ